jgi:hypothetical protein
MVGFLKTIESPAGQTIGLIRENGQIEDCAVVDPADVGGAAAAVRARWGLGGSASITFAPGVGPSRDIVTEPGTFAGINAGDTIFFQPTQCLQGFFHSGTPAPELGGVYLITAKADDQEMTVERVAELSTAAQFAAVGLISVDEGAGAGVYQNATPNPVVVDTTPQVMPWVAAPPIVDGSTYYLREANGQLSWVQLFLDGDTLLVPVPAMPANTYADVTIASVPAIGAGFVGVATINDPGGFPREANLSIPMVFSDTNGQITFRFFGTVAAPVTQSVSYTRTNPTFL